MRQGFLGGQVRRLAMAGGIVTCLILFAAPRALGANCSTCTWSGAAAPTSGAPAPWSNGGNWQGGNPPSSSVTSLTFPGTVTCATGPGANPCFSTNDIASFGTTMLTLDDTTSYSMSGNSVSLGSGGLQTTASNCSSTGFTGTPFLSLPMTLTASQSWSIFGCPSTSPGFGALYLAGAITGTSSTLGVSMSNFPSLGLSNIDVGPLSFTGNGFVSVFSFGSAPTINGTTNHAVSFSGGAGLGVFGNGTAGNSASSGPLTLTNGFMSVGGGGGSDIVFNVHGPFSLSSGSYSTSIDGAGVSPGATFSQLKSSGVVTVGGGLGISGSDPSTGSCPTLNVGDVYLLITGTSRSGTFSNAADGSTQTVSCGPGTPPTVRINYTSTGMTATVLTPGSPTVATTTTLSHSPQSPASGQSTTLTSSVTGADGGTPTGTVAFTDNGNQISGCGAQAVNGTGTATCTTSFGPGTHNLTATFTPSSGSYYRGSSGNDSLTVPSPTPPSSPPPSTPPAPTVTTQGASPVGTTTVTLNGLIDTHGQAVTWQFQYGQSLPYNKATPVQTIAAGHTQPVPVSWSLTGLNPLTGYHFRLVAVTPASSNGQDLTFMTKATGSLLLSLSKLKVIGGFAWVPLKCVSKLKCSGLFSITTKAKVGKQKKAGTVLCDTTSFTIKPNKTMKVKAKIYAACLALLHSAPGHRIKAQFSSRPRTGQFGLIKYIFLSF